MSEKVRRALNESLDAWLARIAHVQEGLDELRHLGMQQYADALAVAPEAVRRARIHDDPDMLPWTILSIARVFDAAQSVLFENFEKLAAKQSAAFELCLDGPVAELDRLVDELLIARKDQSAVTLHLAEREAARRAALATGRKTQQEKRKVNLEAARAEYERLLANGHSKRRASTIAGERHGLSPDTLRKRRP